MPSDSMPPAPGLGQGQPTTAPEDKAGAAAWRREFEEFGPSRVAQVNASAQSWLGVMTTLLGLFSAVVVINQGAAISELPVGTVWRGLLFALAVLVYGFAFIAVAYGAAAVSGGLGFGGERPEPPVWLGRLPGLRRPSVRLWEFWNPASLSELPPNYTWKSFRDYRLKRAETLRTHLHRSRLLGVAAAILAGVLALAVLGIGAFVHPPQAPTSVVVVQGGEVTCGSIDVDADGQTRVGGRVISRATQVVVVARC